MCRSNESRESSPENVKKRWREGEKYTYKRSVCIG